MPAGNWRRPEYYAVPGKTRAQAIAAEVGAVRTRVGLIDVGTLGKIEVHGPHAAEFLERVYTARYANLRIGMSRYGLMLDESGVVVDDGVVARSARNRFTSRPRPVTPRRCSASSVASRRGGACRSAS